MLCHDRGINLNNYKKDYPIFLLHLLRIISNTLISNCKNIKHTMLLQTYHLLFFVTGESFSAIKDKIILEPNYVNGITNEK